MQQLKRDEMSDNLFPKDGIVRSQICSKSLASDALRIYLTYALQETKNLLEVYQPKAAAAIRFYSESAPDVGHWTKVVALVNRIRCYIENCLVGPSFGIWYELCAIGEIHEAVIVATRPLNNGDGYGTRMLLVEEHILRGKLLVNGLIAEQQQDQELASLWVLAAQQVQMKSELKCLGNNNDTSIPRSVTELTKLCLVKAAYVENKKSECAEETELQQLASRYYRRSAVFTILGRIHAYKFAAETYQQALVLCQSSIAADTNSITLPLWQSAVASMRLAGDMIAVHTDEASAKNDPLITQTIATAKRLAEDAASVPTLLAFQEEWIGKIEATKTEITKCRDPAMMSVLKLLVEKQELVQCTNQQYLQALLRCDISAVPWVEQKREVAGLVTTASVVEISVRKLGLLIHNALNYRAQTRKAHKTSHDGVRSLLYICWTKAADEAESVLLQIANSTKEDILKALKTEFSCAGGDFENIAECLLGTAVEYLDKARGAEAGERVGRDPREAQMWRKAAECLVQRAELMLQTYEEESRNPSWCKNSIGKATKLATPFAQVADYLSRSFQYRQQTCASDAAGRISELYAHLATLHMQRITSECAPTPATTVLPESEIRSFLFTYLEVLTLSAPLTPEISSFYEKGCIYAHACQQAVCKGATSAPMWKSAFLQYSSELRSVQCKSFHSSSIALKIALASVYSLAAEADDKGKVKLAMTSAKAASLLSAPYTNATDSSGLNKHQVALAVRMLSLADCSASGDDPVEIPEELQQLYTVNDDPLYQALLQEQTHAYCLDVECAYQLSLLPKDAAEAVAWTDAKNAVFQWLLQLSLCAKNFVPSSSPAPLRTCLRTYCKLAAQCFIEAAKSCSSGEVVEVWDRAVELCRTVNAKTGLSPEQRESATAALQHFILAAEAAAQGDLELSALRSKVANAARTIFVNATRSVSERFRSFNDDADKCDLKHAELTVQALLALRAGRKRLAKMWKEAAKHWQKLGDSQVDFMNLKDKEKGAALQAFRKLREVAEHCEAKGREFQSASGDPAEEEDEGAADTESSEEEDNSAPLVPPVPPVATKSKAPSGTSQVPPSRTTQKSKRSIAPAPSATKSVRSSAVVSSIKPKVLTTSQGPRSQPSQQPALVAAARGEVKPVFVSVRSKTSTNSTNSAARSLTTRGKGSSAASSVKANKS